MSSNVGVLLLLMKVLTILCNVTHKNPDTYLSDIFSVPPPYASAPSPSHNARLGVLLFLRISFTALTCSLYFPKLAVLVYSST